jgi:FkbM family methyltransferase
MRALKRLLKLPLTALGYDIRKKSHIGFDAINDIKMIYAEQSPRVIFDVGAHRGETATLLAKTFPHAQIHSFEPAPETFGILQHQVSAFKNVQTVNAALGRRNDRLQLNVNKSTATNSLLPRGRVDDQAVADLMEPVTTTTVRVQTMDDYCEEAGVDVVDLLKMDVQGFEIEVLAGAQTLLSNSRIPSIYCEIAFKALYEGQPLFEDVHRELTKNGFRLVDLYGHVRSQFHGIEWCDALFVHANALTERIKSLA